MFLLSETNIYSSDMSQKIIDEEIANIPLPPTYTVMNAKPQTSSSVTAVGRDNDQLKDMARPNVNKREKKGTKNLFL